MESNKSTYNFEKSDGVSLEYKIEHIFMYY